MNLRFEWDDEKVGKNFRKHDISFDEAQTVFGDPLAFIFDDEAHSVSEKREIIIGHSADGRILIVCFTERREGVVRIFSSRPATRRERRKYEESTVF